MPGAGPGPRVLAAVFDVASVVRVVLLVAVSPNSCLPRSQSSSARPRSGRPCTPALGTIASPRQPGRPGRPPRHRRHGADRGSGGSARSGNLAAPVPLAPAGYPRPPPSACCPREGELLMAPGRPPIGEAFAREATEAWPTHMEAMAHDAPHTKSGALRAIHERCEAIAPGSPSSRWTLRWRGPDWARVPLGFRPAVRRVGRSRRSAGAGSPWSIGRVGTASGAMGSRSASLSRPSVWSTNFCGDRNAEAPRRHGRGHPACGIRGRGRTS